MPRGPRGEKRPADVVRAAVMVGRIATGEVEDTTHKSNTERRCAWSAWWSQGRQGAGQEAIPRKKGPR